MKALICIFWLQQICIFWLQEVLSIVCTFEREQVNQTSCCLSRTGPRFDTSPGFSFQHFLFRFLKGIGGKYVKLSMLCYARNVMMCMHQFRLESSICQLPISHQNRFTITVEHQRIFWWFKVSSRHHFKQTHFGTCLITELEASQFPFLGDLKQTTIQLNIKI